MIRCQLHKHWGEGDRRARGPKPVMTTHCSFKRRKYAKKFSEIKNRWRSTISSSMEKPWRPDFLLSSFKVCFSFSSCLDSIKPLGREETVWRSCTTIYNHLKNNICPFNEYKNPFERTINGKFWKCNQYFLNLFYSFSECRESCRLISWLPTLPPHVGSGFSSCLMEYMESYGINCSDKLSPPLGLLKCQTPRAHAGCHSTENHWRTT